jgi:hypothetical protein
MHLAVNPGRRRAINLDAIAGGQQHDFIESGIQLEPAAVAGQKGRAHRQPFAHFHGRGLVAQTCDKNFHANISPVKAYPRDVLVIMPEPAPNIRLSPALQTIGYRHSCFTVQIYRMGKKLLPIHWQALYIYCHWNSHIYISKYE